MASALLTAPLGTTPPQNTRSTPAKRSSGSGIVAFRTSTSEDVTGSFGRTPSSSFAEIGSWRSFSRSSTHNESAQLRHSASIPKSASFVKVEGFDTKGTTPATSPPSSPGRTLVGKAPGLLTREFSHDNLPGPLYDFRPSSMPSSEPTTSDIVQRLEECCNIKVEPKPRPASIPRPSALPDDLLNHLQIRYPVFKEPLVIRAFNISRLAHDGRYDGPGGEPAFIRCASSAAILAELGADEASIAGALLHDVLDRTMLLETQLRTMLGSDEVIDLVKKISHVGYICSKFTTTADSPSFAASVDDGASMASPLHAAGVVDMIVAHCPPRALLVRLAVALQEARSTDARASNPSGLVSTPRISAEHKRYARNMLSLWAPLANRLGVWSLKAELEDRAFRVLHPAEHAALRDMLTEAQSPARLVALADKLRAELQKQGVEYIDLSGRPKHLWGVWCKMQNKGYRPEQIADVRGLRVIVKTREDCYKAMRAVETVWQVAAPPKNYIKCPKENGYQSLHAVADAGDGHMVEIQIRTDKMHYLAEYGAQAAHWKYKESTKNAASSKETVAATETSWAKYAISQQVVTDKKCRPSGSPEQDQSLNLILASIDGTAASPGSSPPSASNGRKSFLEYIEASGQRPAPPSEPTRALVAVVCDGTGNVVSIPTGTTLQQLLDQLGAGLHPGHVSAVVNRHLASSPEAVLKPGDIVEVYTEQRQLSSSASPRHYRPDYNLQQTGRISSGPARLVPAQGNMLPLGQLKRPLAGAVGSAHR